VLEALNTKHAKELSEKDQALLGQQNLGRENESLKNKISNYNRPYSYENINKNSGKEEEKLRGEIEGLKTSQAEAIDSLKKQLEIVYNNKLNDSNKEHLEAIEKLNKEQNKSLELLRKEHSNKVDKIQQDTSLLQKSFINNMNEDLEGLKSLQEQETKKQQDVIKDITNELGVSNGKINTWNEKNSYQQLNSSELVTTANSMFNKILQETLIEENERISNELKIKSQQINNLKFDYNNNLVSKKEEKQRLNLNYETSNYNLKNLNISNNNNKKIEIERTPLTTISNATIDTQTDSNANNNPNPSKNEYNYINSNIGPTNQSSSNYIGETMFENNSFNNSSATSINESEEHKSLFETNKFISNERKSNQSITGTKEDMYEHNKFNISTSTNTELLNNSTTKDPINTKNYEYIHTSTSKDDKIIQNNNDKDDGRVLKILRDMQGKQYNEICPDYLKQNPIKKLEEYIQSSKINSLKPIKEDLQKALYSSVKEALKNDMKNVAWEKNGNESVTKININGKSFEMKEKTIIKEGLTYRNIDIPTNANYGKEGNDKIDTGFTLMLALKDKDGKDHDNLSMTISYDKDGKLVEITHPEPIKFSKDGKIGSFKGDDGKEYTIPVNKSHYDTLMAEVVKNGGMACNLAEKRELLEQTEKIRNNLKNSNSSQTSGTFESISKVSQNNKGTQADSNNSGRC
jgi:hypothetical protein